MKTLGHDGRRSSALRRSGSRGVDALPCPRSVDPGTACEANELGSALASALAALRAQVSERSYQALYLTCFTSLSASEVAAQRGLTTGEARTLRHRARRKLRVLLRGGSEAGGKVLTDFPKWAQIARHAYSGSRQIHLYRKALR